jgi:hypothetical protein
MDRGISLLKIRNGIKILAWEKEPDSVAGAAGRSDVQSELWLSHFARRLLLVMGEIT